MRSSSSFSPAFSEARVWWGVSGVALTTTPFLALLRPPGLLPLFRLLLLPLPPLLRPPLLAAVKSPEISSLYSELRVNDDTDVEVAVVPVPVVAPRSDRVRRDDLHRRCPCRPIAPRCRFRRRPFVCFFSAATNVFPRVIFDDGNEFSTKFCSKYIVAIIFEFILFTEIFDCKQIQYERMYPKWWF